jgi:A/G-specific adenine glycosylase
MTEPDLTISDDDIRFLREQLLQWSEDNFADFPWRTTDNHWHALAVEIMLQRTRAEQVVPAYEDFTAQYPTPADLAADPDSNVFETLGLHWREALLNDLAQTLADNGGTIPEDSKSLKALPGVGDYIAAAYRSMHLGLPDTIIDSNVVRLYGRFFGFETHGETRRRRWFKDLAQRVTPDTPDNKDSVRQFSYALLDFTREICARKPLCDVCPLRDRCDYYAMLDSN